MTAVSRGFTEDDVPDQSGRTFLVTGANTGLGFETARALAARGARVLMACRSESKARAAIEAITRVVPDADLAFVPLDQSSLSSVRAAVGLVLEEPRLDVLVNNAGIMMPPYELTADGFESQFGVNHLGTFALTALLLEKLAAQEGSRVVVTSSLAHRFGEIFFDDINAEKRYISPLRYGQSKLANLSFMYELDRRLSAAGSRTIAVGCHPGLASTELSRHFPSPYRAIEPMVGRLFNSSAAGAWTTLMAATGTTVARSDYVGPSQLFETAGPATRARSSAKSRDRELGRRLWELSVAMTRLDPGL